MSALSVTLNKKTDTTQYLWDINHGLPQILTESDAKGTALYTYGLGRISMADPRKGPMYYQYDGLGSVRSLTDRKGMTRGLYAYDAFGKPLISASLVDNDFQYTGEQVDDETGLIYLRSRYYDPEIGRFISRDSFPGFDTSTQSLNRYVYVQNNPVVYTDPSGKVAPAVAWALLAAGGAGVAGAASQWWSDVQANTAAGKTGMARYMPKSSWVNYGISVGGPAIAAAAAVAAFPVVAGYTAGIAGISVIAPPVASFSIAIAGFSGTNYAKSYVNEKPFDVQASTRQSTIMAAGLAYPPYYAISNVLKIPGVVSLIAGPDATNQFMDNHFSGGARGIK
jgi:RHS repeat-associated protein